MDKEELKARTKDFAHRCVKLCMALPSHSLGNHIRNQLIRCSTSVGANYRAACVAQSKAGFVAKLSIVVEEIDEACFWMEFIVVLTIRSLVLQSIGRIAIAGSPSPGCY